MINNFDKNYKIVSFINIYLKIIYLLFIYLKFSIIFNIINYFTVTLLDCSIFCLF